MGAVYVRTTDEGLLNIDYSDPEIIKSLIRNWSMIERLARKGNPVAPCILVDLEKALGVNISEMGKGKYNFENNRASKVLTDLQFICVVYVLGMGYSQDEMAYVLGCTKKVVNLHIARGLRKICIYLEGEEAVKRCDKEKRGRSSGQVAKRERSVLYRKRKGKKKRRISVPNPGSGSKKKKKRGTYKRPE